jgi:predicted nucleotidyltransferase
MNPGFGLAPNEARVLTALLRVETPVTGRAVARITGMTQSTAQRALARLREAGFVVAEPAPPSLLYRANTDHLAMPAMLALLRIGDELRNRMAERIAQWPMRPVSVVIYGSVARGDATTGSDLDVLVVRSDATEPDDPTWQHQLAELADRVYRWTGKRASVIDMRRREAVEGLGDQEPFLVEAGRDGWLVAGQPLGELSSGCSSIPG